MAKKQKKNPYMCGRMIEPLRLKPNDSVVEFIENVFAASGYNARRLGEAAEIFSRMIEEDATIAFTLAGAMTPIGMSGPLIEMMEAGFVDFIVSTGANLYHDFHRAYNFPVVQGEPLVDDEALNRHGVARIYDTFIEDSETLLPTDAVIIRAVRRLESSPPMSSATLHHTIGREVMATAPFPEKSFVAAAARLNVPVYTSSPGDSSIGMNMLVPFVHGFRITVDPVLDVLETTAVVREGKKNGVVIVGGGSPKNFYLQTQPTLWQILRDNQGGHDFFIQLTTDAPQWGGLSGATPQEAKSWGKVKGLPKTNVVVYSCASITFPLLCKYILAKHKPRKRKQLFKSLPELRESLLTRTKNNKEFRKAYGKLMKRL